MRNWFLTITSWAMRSWSTQKWERFLSSVCCWNLLLFVVFWQWLVLLPLTFAQEKNVIQLSLVHDFRKPVCVLCFLLVAWQRVHPFSFGFYLYRLIKDIWEGKKNNTFHKLNLDLRRIFPPVTIQGSWKLRPIPYSRTLPLTVTVTEPTSTFSKNMQATRSNNISAWPQLLVHSLRSCGQLILIQ